MSMNYSGDDPKSYVQIACGPGKTKQSFQKQVDINTIIAKYVKTGFLDQVRDNPGVFADVSSVGDFHGMMNKIQFAQEAFMKLPSSLRARFGNDPGRLVGFISDSSNRDEAIKLGLIPKPSAKAVKAPKPVVPEDLSPLGVPAPQDPEPKAPVPKEASKKS